MAKKMFKALDNLSPSDIKLTQLPRKSNGLHNFSFNEYGRLVKRKGYIKYNTDTINADHKIVGLHRFYKQDTGDKEFLVACNQNIYSLATAAGHAAGTAIKTSLQADQETFFANFYDSCYIVNGYNGMFKYDGTNFRTVGITPPTTKAVLNAGGSGSLSAGDYKVKYTYIDEDGYESNASPASDAETATANQLITCQVYESSDAKVTLIRIYRTSVNGALYYFDREVANSTGPFWLTQADTTLSQGTVLHTNHDAPPNTPHLITKRRTRIILADNDAFYISHIADVEYFPAAWFIYTGSRQKITGLMEQKEWLPVFTEDTVERLTGQDEDNFEFKNCYSVEGCIALRSLASCNNLLVYLGCDGIYYFDGSISKILNIPLSEYIKENINPTYAYLSAGTFFDNKYLLSYPKKDTNGDSEIPNETIYIDFRTGITGIYNFGFGTYCRWDQGTDGLQLYSGSTTEGRVYKVFDGLEDDTGNITAYDDIEPIDFNKSEVYKQFYSIFIKIKSTTATTLTMYYTLDDESEASKTKSISANTTKWYRIGLGSGGKRARSIAPRPYISDKYDFEIHGLMVCYEEEIFAEEKE